MNVASPALASSPSGGDDRLAIECVPTKTSEGIEQLFTCLSLLVPVGRDKLLELHPDEVVRIVANALKMVIALDTGRKSSSAPPSVIGQSSGRLSRTNRGGFRRLTLIVR